MGGSKCLYAYVDGIYLKRNWGGECIVEIAINEDDHREILGTTEGMKEDRARGIDFFQWLRGRGLSGVSLALVAKAWYAGSSGMSVS